MLKGKYLPWASSWLVRIKRRCSKLMNSRTVSCSENFGMALMKAGACAPGLQCAVCNPMANALCNAVCSKLSCEVLMKAGSKALPLASLHLHHILSAPMHPALSSWLQLTVIVICNSYPSLSLFLAPASPLKTVFLVLTLPRRVFVFFSCK